MPSSYTLGQHFEAFIQAQLATGRYTDASEVIRDALRLMEERKRRLVGLDAAIARGMADIAAGRTNDADAVFKDSSRTIPKWRASAESCESPLLDPDEDEERWVTIGQFQSYHINISRSTPGISVETPAS